MSRSAILFCAASLALDAADAINPHSAILADFEKRVADYVQLRKQVESKTPHLHATVSPENILEHQRKLQHAMEKARTDARPGDIFTAPVQEEFRRLIQLAMQPGDGHRIAGTLRDEPVAVHPAINRPYPDPGKAPLKTTPPTILLNLPRLPDDIEYRFVNRNLILLDTRSNLVVDYISDVGP